MPRPLQLADLAVGQRISFRTLTRPWRDYEVVSIDAQRGRMLIKLPTDNSATPRVQLVPLGDIIPATLELLP